MCPLLGTQREPWGTRLSELHDLAPSAFIRSEPQPPRWHHRLIRVIPIAAGVALLMAGVLLFFRVGPDDTEAVAYVQATATPSRAPTPQPVVTVTRIVTPPPTPVVTRVPHRNAHERIARHPRSSGKPRKARSTASKGFCTRFNDFRRRICRALLTGR